jgi:tetratricopeptide (TPR) repeat protein
LSPISQRFAIPTNDDVFEKMCRDLLRFYWSRPGLEIFGKRGERQFGIDILDLGGVDPLYGAQCKLKEQHKTLPPSVIEDEVAEARQFSPPLEKYGILTTAKVSTQAQRKIREINQAHKAGGLFEVELLTWENICELLQRYSEVQEDYYGEITPRLATKIESGLMAIRSGVDSLTSRVEGTEIDIQINEAREYVTRREFQLATLLLNRIHLTKGHLLSSYQNFRISSNLGASALGAGQPEIASKYFLEALSHQPNDERAKTNEVLAYLIIGDSGGAHEKAQRLRSEYSASARLAAYWVTSAPNDTQFADLERETSSILRTDAEVSLALARRALTESNFAAAERYAENAARVSPQWSQPQLVIGYIHMGQVVMGNVGQLPVPANKSALEHSKQALSHAISLAEAEKDSHTQVAGLVARVDVQLLQKDGDSAREDAEAACRIDPLNPQALVALSQVRFSSNNIEQGIVALEKAFRINPRADVGFMYGRALLMRGQEADLDTAIAILTGIELSQVPPSLRPATASQAIQSLIKKKEWESACKYLERIKSHLAPSMVETLLGYIAHHEGSPQRAENHAIAAQSLLSGTISADIQESLAALFMLLGRPADALPIFQALFNANIPAFDPGHLLDCAARLHRDDIVIDTCETLHQRGANDWKLVSFEVHYLEKYHTERAIQRLDAFLRENPEHKLAKLGRSIIGVKTNRPELVASSLRDLPDIADLPSEYALAAVHVIRFRGNADDAVDYAYRFLRMRFQDMRAHQALELSMLPGDPAPNISSQIEKVGIGTAVCYQELPNGDTKWVVLEDTTHPVAEFEEISGNAPLAVELLGKGVGDLFVLAEGSMRTRQGIIRQILSKYVRRFQDSMGEMQIRFGKSSPVESLQVGSTEQEMQEGVQAILESVKNRASAIAKVRDLYQELSIPLHYYGDHLGKNAYVGLLDLAQEDGQTVKCCSGTIEERNGATYALQTAQAVVVDLTVVATLRLLDLEKILSTRRFRFLLSEGTWNELQEMFLERVFSAASKSIGYRDGAHTIHEESAELKQERRRNNEVFLDQIKKDVQIVPVLELAALDPSKREPLVELVGQYGAESIVLASNPDYVLWSDDLIQAQIAAKEYGVRRAWTQLVISQLADAGLLTFKERDRASAQLVGMEFVATLFDSSTILEAVELSDGKAWRRPLKEVVKVFDNSKGDIRSLLGIFADFITKLYRETLLPETRCSVVGAFLDALWKNLQARKILLEIRKSSSRFFGLNAVGETQFNECFDRWVKHNENPILPA